MKPYLEAFFTGEWLEGNVFITPISQEMYHSLEGVAAEVTIPLNKENADYGIIVMLTHRSADEPAIEETLNLHKDAEAIVAGFRPYFKHHTSEEGS